MQWHRLDHIQTICTSLQTDNHTNTSSLNFYRLDALPDAQPTVSKHWRHKKIKNLSQSINRYLRLCLSKGWGFWGKQCNLDHIHDLYISGGTAAAFCGCYGRYKIIIHVKLFEESVRQNDSIVCQHAMCHSCCCNGTGRERETDI